VKLKYQYPEDTLTQALSSLLKKQMTPEETIYQQVPIDIDGNRYILRLQVENALNSRTSLLMS